MARLSGRIRQLEQLWKRFGRLRQSGVFEAFFEALAAMSKTAHLVQKFVAGKPACLPKLLYKARARIEQAVVKIKLFKTLLRTKQLRWHYKCLQY